MRVRIAQGERGVVFAMVRVEDGIFAVVKPFQKGNLAT